MVTIKSASVLTIAGDISISIPKEPGFIVKVY